MRDSRIVRDNLVKTGILLFHGISGMPEEFRYLSNTLEREGYVVSAPLIPGLGCGTDVAHLAKWEDWLSAAEKAFFALEGKCDRVIVGGLSAGATLALELCNRYQDRVAGVVLLAPTLKVNGFSIPWTFKLFTLCQQSIVARLFNFSEREPFGLKDERIRKMAMDAMRAASVGTADQFFQVNGMIFYQLRRLRRQLIGKLSNISRPTLIIHPRDDDQSSVTNALYLQTRLSGPMEVLILDDSYHVVTLDKQRQIVAERDSSFAARLNVGQQFSPQYSASAQ
ncbi:MAG: esterase [Hyphomicrobium sp.]|nr:MAG: esterase [Hyphomicrobium sp.]